MKKSLFSLMATVAVSIVLSVTSALTHADTMIRIKCYDDNVGALVYINKKEMGECPLDMAVPAGMASLRVVKTVGEDQERVFERNLKIVDGVVQGIEVNLSAPEVTADGKRKRHLAEFNALLQGAKSGQIAAMYRLADAYKEGRITGKDPAQAEMWRANADRATDAQAKATKKAEAERLRAAEVAEAKAQLSAAQSGNIPAMEKIAAYYQTGKGVLKSDSEAAKWRNQAKVAIGEQEARRAEEKRTQAEVARKAQVQAKIDKVSFVENFMGAGAMALPPPPQRENSSHITSFAIVTPFGTVFDLISAPFKTTQLQVLKSELALRPSTWGAPDSMIARASRRADAPVEVASLVK